MAYGLNSAVLTNNGPVAQRQEAQLPDPNRSSWQLLSEACRLALVERALTGAQDFGRNPQIAL